MTQPLLSLVTPSLNQRHYLGRLLGNVRALGRDVEHIVIDGGSKDGTLDLLHAHADSDEHGHFRFVSEPDGGMYDAVNRGLEMTTADICGYINCDDDLLPWTFAEVLAAFRSRASPDLLIGDALELSGTRAAFTIHPPTRLLLPYLQGDFFLAQPAVFFRRHVFRDLGGFDRRYTLLADHHFFCRAMSRGFRVARCWEVLAVARKVAGQLMQRFAERVQHEHAQVRDDLGWRTPSGTQRLLQRSVTAALHRLAIGVVVSGRRLPSSWGKWQAMRHCGYVAATSQRRLLSAIASTNQEITFAELTPAGQAALGVIEP